MKENMEKKAVEKEIKKKGIRVYIPLVVIVLIVLSGSYYWYREYQKYIKTDDAHIDSDNVAISSKILGRIMHLYAEEGDSVKKGMLLVDLDSTDLIAQVHQAIALKTQNSTALSQSEAKYRFDMESMKVPEVNVEKAKEDWDRAKSQLAVQVITKEAYDHAKKALDAATAQYDASQSQLQVSKAQTQSAASAIESAQAQVNVLQTMLKNTKLYAPVNGVIAKRWLMAGDITQPGQSILTLNNNKNTWVSVYLEETKVGQLHLNQKAKFDIDAYPGVVFTGKVISIGSNTAAQFSLIPPNNAAGNFTKVTQRVQVKISIDGTENNSNLKNYQLLAGMSVVMKIIKD
jgi:membrane fusion protein (multidrug efflux system)